MRNSGSGGGQAVGRKGGKLSKGDIVIGGARLFEGKTVTHDFSEEVEKVHRYGTRGLQRDCMCPLGTIGR